MEYSSIRHTELYESGVYKILNLSDEITWLFQETKVSIDWCINIVMTVWDIGHTELLIDGVTTIFR